MREKLRRLVRSDMVRRAVCWLIAQYVRFVFATSRWTVIGPEIPRRFHDANQPFILAFWHGRLLMMPMAWRRDVKIHMLISGHRDGRIIADAVRHFGISSIAGSSSRGGSAALRAMVKTLRQGECVGITPDGPRGPAMAASDGIVAAARLAEVPIIPLSYATRRRRVMRTWDRFHLPPPFTRGIHIWGEPIVVPGDADAATLELYRRRVEDGLNALGAEADRRMGHEPDMPEPLEAASLPPARTAFPSPACGGGQGGGTPRASDAGSLERRCSEPRSTGAAIEAGASPSLPSPAGGGGMWAGGPASGGEMWGSGPASGRGIPTSRVMGTRRPGGGA